MLLVEVMSAELATVWPEEALEEMAITIVKVAEAFWATEPMFQV